MQRNPKLGSIVFEQVPRLLRPKLSEGDGVIEEPPGFAGPPTLGVERNGDGEADVDGEALEEASGPDGDVEELEDGEITAGGATDGFRDTEGEGDADVDSEEVGDIVGVTEGDAVGVAVAVPVIVGTAVASTWRASNGMNTSLSSAVNEKSL